MQHTTHPEQPVIWPLSVVIEICNTSKASVYRALRRNDFPRPVRLSPRRIGWLSSDIMAWLESRREPLGKELGHAHDTQ